MNSASQTPKSKHAEALRLIGRALLLLADEESVTIERIEWISHRDPRGLGPRRQPPIVRRRISQGLGGARIVGRSFELTLDAVADESSTLSREHVATSVDPEPVSVTDELERELRAVGGT